MNLPQYNKDNIFLEKEGNKLRKRKLSLMNTDIKMFEKI